MTVELEVIADTVVELEKNYATVKADTLGIADRIEVLEAKIDRMQETLSQMVELVGAIKNEVGPAIDAVAASPVGKMLGMGRKNDE